MAGAPFRIDISNNIDHLMRGLTDLERNKIPFVTAYALTKTAQDAKAAEVEVMAKVFDRPTRFTLNALYVQSATKADLTAMVRFKEGFGSVPAWRYLGPQVEGGPRRHKSFERALIRAGVMRSDEFAMPGLGASLDQHGNIKGGIITRVLSDIGANPDPQSNTTARSRKRNARRRSGRYIVLRNGVKPGIYLRTGGRQIVPFLLFTRAPNYEKRFPFYETAQRVFRQRFAMHFRAGFRNFVRRPVRRAA